MWGFSGKRPYLRVENERINIGFYWLSWRGNQRNLFQQSEIHEKISGLLLEKQSKNIPSHRFVFARCLPCLPPVKCYLRVHPSFSGSNSFCHQYLMLYSLLSLIINEHTIFFSILYFLFFHIFTIFNQFVFRIRDEIFLHEKIDLIDSDHKYELKYKRNHYHLQVILYIFTSCELADKGIDKVTSNLIIITS